MQFIVFEQVKDKTSRVDRIIGPFTSYDLAADYALHMSDTDGDYHYYGVRQLERTQTARMSD